MGLAILPPRLAQELREVEKVFIKSNPIKLLKVIELGRMNSVSKPSTEANVKEVIQQGIGTIFVQILTDAVSLNVTEEGRRAFERLFNVLKMII